jgi:hypothetical protein
MYGDKPTETAIIQEIKMKEINVDKVTQLLKTEVESKHEDWTIGPGFIKTGRQQIAWEILGLLENENLEVVEKDRDKMPDVPTGFFVGGREVGLAAYLMKWAGQEYYSQYKVENEPSRRAAFAKGFTQGRRRMAKALLSGLKKGGYDIVKKDPEAEKDRKELDDFWKRYRTPKEELPALTSSYLKSIAATRFEGRGNLAGRPLLGAYNTGWNDGRTKLAEHILDRLKVVKPEKGEPEIKVKAPARNSENADICPEKGYESLWKILVRAHNQAAYGKGKKRHATGQPFEEQPIMEIMETVEGGFGSGQALKKIRESTRLGPVEAVTELLGAIVYLGAVIIFLEKKEEEGNGG